MTASSSTSGSSAQDTVVFLDCEFTSLLRPSLLSMGLVTLEGAEHYAELDIGQVRKAYRAVSKLVQREVLPQFGTSGQSRANMAQAVCQWLRQWTCAGPVAVCYDYHADFDLLEELLKEAGEEGAAVLAALQATPVAYLWGAPEALDAATWTWDALTASRGLRRHHALADALALRAAYQAVHG